MLGTTDRDSTVSTTTVVAATTGNVLLARYRLMEGRSDVRGVQKEYAVSLGLGEGAVRKGGQLGEGYLEGVQDEELWG